MSDRTMYVCTQGNGYLSGIVGGQEPCDRLRGRETRCKAGDFKGLQKTKMTAKMMSVPSSMAGSAKVSSEFSLSPAPAKLRLLKRLRCTLRYEKNAWSTGAVMGAGEIGRAHV